jgi:hypothetical protein
MKNPNYQLLKEIFQLEELKVIKANKKRFVKAVCNMDIEALQNILENNITYQGTSKAIFLQKLKQIFIEFKEIDTRLLAYQSKCCSNECVNLNNKGVCFVGDNSGRHLNLIIEANKNDFITNIYNCHAFCTKENVDKTSGALNITIFYDERVEVEHIPITRYNYAKIKYVSGENQPTKELMPLINKEKVAEWLITYKSVFETSEYPFSLFENRIEFMNVYNGFKELFELLELEALAAGAIKDFEKVELNEKEQLLKWLEQYKTLYINLEKGYKLEKFRDAYLDNTKLLSKYIDNFLSISVLKNVIHITALYKIHY